MGGFKSILNGLGSFTGRHYKKLVAVFLVFVVIVVSVAWGLGHPDRAYGTTYTWSQSDWSGGLDAGSNPVHPTNSTNWTKYGAKDANTIAQVSGLSLGTTASSTTQTADTDFAGGSGTHYQVAGTGSGASLTLGGGTTNGKLIVSSDGDGFTGYAVKADGTVWAWGSGSSGQLGVGSYSSTAVPVQTNITSVVDLATGDAYAIAVKSNGTVWAWGIGNYGVIGDGATSGRTSPVQTGVGVTGFNNMVAVAASYYASFALKSDGTVWAWGHNDQGQLGIGSSDNNNHTSPVQVGVGVSGFTNITAISAGMNGAMALKSDGTVWAWGRGDLGTVGDGNTTAKVVSPVQVGVGVSGFTNITAISAAYYVNYALKSDGTVWAWGLGANGAIGDGTTNQRNSPVQTLNLTNIVNISGGYTITTAVKSDGTVWAWGKNDYGQMGSGSVDSNIYSTPVQITGLSDFASARSGSSYVLALKNDGTVWGWGRSDMGQLGINQLTYSTSFVQTNIPSPSIGSKLVSQIMLAYHGLYARADGTVWGWGYNTSGQLGDGTYTNKFTPTQTGVGTAGFSSISAVSGGTDYSLALKSDGTVWGWGANNYFQIGDGSPVGRSKPVRTGSQTTGFDNITAISAGGQVSLARKSDGTVWGWGYNTFGQLGDGTKTTRSSPVQVGVGVTGFDNITTIAAGNYVGYALKSDGTVWAWGKNDQGQLGIGGFDSNDHLSPVQVGVGVTGFDNITAIAAGINYALALKSDGTVWGWGYDYYGNLGSGTTHASPVTSPIQAGVGVSGFSGITGISAGSIYSLAVKSDGTVWAWGYNGFGNFGTGNKTDSSSPIQVNISNAVSASASYYTSYVLKNDGTVWASGDSAYYELGNNDPLYKTTAQQVLGVNGSGYFNSLTTAYANSGDYTSPSLELPNTGYATLTWNATVPANTTLKFQLRSASTQNGLSSATWYGPTGISDYYTVSGTSINAANGADRWLQYKVFFTTTDSVQTPAVADLTVNFNTYVASSTLTSSAFNTTDVANALAKIVWTASTPTGTSVKFQVRTAPNLSGVPGTWSDWCGPDNSDTGCDTSTYFTSADGSQNIDADLMDGSNDQWVQYKVYLSTTDGSVTPDLTNATVTYVVNATPIITNVTASQGSDGKVAVTYDVADTDNATQTINLGYGWGASLSGAIDSSAASLTVSSADHFPTTGSIYIDNEEIAYATKAGSSLSGLTRGTNNTNAAAHAPGAEIFVKAVNATGDVGNGVAIGSGKTFSATVAQDLPVLKIVDMVAKVFANDGNLANQVGSNSSAAFAVDTTPPGAVSASSVKAEILSSSSAKITWLTDKDSNSVVDYGPNTGYGFTAKDDTLAQSHSVTLTDLQPATTYYYRVKSTDAFNNTLVDDNQGFSFSFITVSVETIRTPSDTTPPNISGATLTQVTSSSVTVTWQTDELASTMVNYGRDTSYQYLAGHPDVFETSHSITIAGLVPSTSYHFQAMSLDKSGNKTVSNDLTTTTLSLGGDNGGGTGTGTGSGGTASTTEPTNGDTTDLQAQIDALQAQSAEEAQQIASLQALIATTQGETLAQLQTQLRTLQAEHDQTVRELQTAQASLSQLSSITAERDSALAAQKQAETERDQAQSELSDLRTKILGLGPDDKLTPGELLNIIGKKFADAAKTFAKSLGLGQKGNQAEINEQLSSTITTLKDIADAVPAPQLLAKPQTDIGPTMVTVSWLTDVAANSLVALAESGDYDINKTDPYTFNVGFGDKYVTDHEVVIPNLKPDTVYHYQIRSQPEIGPVARSGDFTFRTQALTAEISDFKFVSITDSSISFSWGSDLPTKAVIKITNARTGQSFTQNYPTASRDHKLSLDKLEPGVPYNLQITSTDESGKSTVSSVIPFTTVLSSAPPQISQVKASSSLVPGKVEKVQTIITWQTDKPATSRVFYEEGASGKNEPANSTSLQDSLTKDHVVIATNFKPGAVYRFRVESVDSLSNKAYSRDYTVLMPQQQATVFDLIFSNFQQTFNFLKR